MKTMQRRIRAALCGMAMASAWPLAMAQTVPSAPPAAITQAPSATNFDAATAAPSSAPSSKEQPSLAQQIAALLAAPAVARDHWGIIVTTLDGKPIYTLNEGQLFQPASNAKLFTTAMALAMLGEDERFETQVVAAGLIDKQGVLHGDLKLVGGGDPSFGTSDLPYLSPSQRPQTDESTAVVAPATFADIEELADKVYATGLRRIEGNILGDDWQILWDPYPPEWSLDDLVYGYGAPVSALSVHDNQINVKVSPDVKSGKSTVQTDPEMPYYTVESQVYTDHMEGLPAPVCDLIGYQRTQGTKKLYVFMPIGALEPEQAPCTQAVAIDDPAEYAAMAFKTALERRGIVVTGTAQAKHDLWRDPNPTTGEDSFVPRTMPDRLRTPYVRALDRGQCMGFFTSAPPQETVIASHESHPLSEDVTYTMKVSQNLHAEVLLRDVGASLSCAGSQRAALNALHLFLPHVGVPAGDFVLVDGSGLSNHDLVTPRAIATLLSFAAHDAKTGAPQPWFAAWKSSLPIGGVDGTLADRFTKAPLKGHVFAKTGTLGEARALSGYLDCASGQTVIFSILVGNHLPGTSADRDVMDQIVAAIAAAE